MNEHEIGRLLAAIFLAGFIGYVTGSETGVYRERASHDVIHDTLCVLAGLKTP